ncbi:MAG: hypothetical protein WBO23_14275 [Burkholderiales bacterium]
MTAPRNERDSELSHIYKDGGWPEPSRQIDKAILAAARREHSFVRRWAPPFALAATVVLSFTILFKTVEEKPDEAMVSLPMPDKPAPSAGKPEATTEKKPTAAPTPTPPQPFASAPKLAPIEHTTPADKAALLPQLAPAPSRAAPALKKEAPQAARADRLEREPESRQRGRALESGPPREARPEVGSEPAPAPQPSQESPPPTSTPSLGASVLSGVAAGRTADAVERSPQAWLDVIRKLKAQGKTEEAGRELDEFRKRHPDYELPGDLR